MEDRAEIYFNKERVSRIKRNYLPIKWTAYQTQAKYGTDQKRMNQLRNYCRGIFRNNNKSFTIRQSNVGTYFSLVQYDDGALIDKFWNCRMFGAGGVGTDPIPLTTQRHGRKGLEKNQLCSFLGSIGTHKIREEIYNELKDKPGFLIENVETNRLNTPIFAKKTEESYFTLCPRGYGKTSFRLYEAMELGSVPIYVSDSHWIPFQHLLDWSKFSLIVKAEDIGKIPDMIEEIMSSGKYHEMAKEAIRAYEEYFCFEKMFDHIYNMLLEE
jgi:hypothetical protein